ncbi:MAG: hypothetical protein ABL893_13080, partial [Hyphomicrobium sp.]
GDVAAQASPSPDATPGAKADQRQEHRQNRGPRRERHSGGNRDGAAAQGAGNAAKPDQRGEGPRPGKPGGGYQGKPGGGHGGGQRGDRPREGGRGDRGPDRGKRDDFRRQPEVISAAPPKRAGIDPESPFATLAALKANMDKRGDGPG